MSIRERDNPVARSEPDFDIDARERDILGHPPRVLPLESPDVIAAALENTGRLRQAASGGAAPTSMHEVPELVVTLLRHPNLYRRITGLAVALARGVLAPRDRELAVLRIGWLCQAPYEWGEHVRLAKQVGFSSEEIERVTHGSSDAQVFSTICSSLVHASSRAHVLSHERARMRPTPGLGPLRFMLRASSRRSPSSVCVA
jgi:alkylhydroperoxidase family enzyme